MVKTSKTAAAAARRMARFAATDAKKKLPVQGTLHQFGYTIKRKPGRPKKLVAPAPPALPIKTPSPVGAAAPPAAVTDERKPAAKRQVHQWNSPESFDVLKRAVLAEADDEKESSPEFASIPRSTFKRLNERFHEAAKLNGIMLKDVESSMANPCCRKTRWNSSAACWNIAI